MKKFRKMIAVVLAVMVALTMGFATTSMVFAQDVGGTQAATGKGQINVSNAAKGETYTIYKLFDATVGEDGEIAYKIPTGGIPNALKTYFEETSEGSGYLQATAAAGTGDEMSDGLKAALKTWAEGQSSNAGTAVSDGSALHFNNLDYGYYVVTTTQGEQAITVDSTNPVANIIDKNTTDISAVKKVNGLDEDTVSIGETVTYTATFATKNYEGEEQVKSYTIKDTLPEFLSDVAITSVKVIETPAEEAVEDDPATTEDESKPAVEEVSTDLSEDYTAFTNKQIVIPWVDDDNNSLYKNGSTIEITYTAKITSMAVIDGDGNTNTVEIIPNKDKTGEDPFEDHATDDAVVKTYGAAVKKTDGSDPLKGAKFTIAGLTVEAVAGETGVYRVVSYDPESTTASAVMDTNADGKLYIIGIASDVTLKVTEYKAPDGYNKLTGTTDLEAQILEESIWTKTEDRYFDAKGNLVSESSSQTTTVNVKKNYTDLDEEAVEIVNQQGTELPSTGGIGTTIFYILGALLVVGCGIILIARRRMNANN